MPRFRRLVLALIASVWASLVSAQQPERIPDAVSCAQCAISLSAQTFLRVPGAHALTGAPYRLRVDAQSRIWMLEGNSILVFDRTGRFRQAIGRRGRGPGEYESTSDVLSLPGDSMLILDPLSARASVLSPELKYVRSMSYPFMFGRGVVLRWPDSVLVSGRTSGPRASVEPLYLMNFAQPSVRATRNFGSVGGVLRPGYSRDITQHINRNARGEVITVDHAAYDITIWSKLGADRKQLQRRPSWFAAPSTQGIGPNSPPPPAISGTWVDASGLLWVATSVPAPGWKSAWSGMALTGGEIKVSSIAVELLYDTVLEVIDPVKARVVARAQLNGWILDVLPGTRLVKYSVDITGEPRVGIIDAKLVR